MQNNISKKYQIFSISIFIKKRDNMTHCNNEEKIIKLDYITTDIMIYHTILNSILSSMYIIYNIWDR